MNAVLYYIALPFVYLISWLPFPMLYLLSDVLYVFIFGIIGYRKKVVLQNLRNSFPEKPEKEILQIRRRFYRYFCDLILEIVKSLTITPRALRKHLILDEDNALREFYEKKQSVIVVMGHYGNWELAGARFGIEGLHKLYVIYHPLASKHFDRLIYRMRTRLGNGLYAMKDTVRAMLRDRDIVTATAFIADQTPSRKNAYWTNFLNQDTPVFTGTEKIARKMGYPVIYASAKRLKRGLYKIEAEVLCADPSNTSEHQISELHTRRLEQDIINDPHIWLWTHRKWKHQRP